MLASAKGCKGRGIPRIGCLGCVPVTTTTLRCPSSNPGPAPCRPLCYAHLWPRNLRYLPLVWCLREWVQVGTGHLCKAQARKGGQLEFSNSGTGMLFVKNSVNTYRWLGLCLRQSAGTVRAVLPAPQPGRLGRLTPR